VAERKDLAIRAEERLLTRRAYCQLEDAPSDLRLPPAVQVRRPDEAADARPLTTCQYIQRLPEGAAMPDAGNAGSDANAGQ
jgi:hypothetical protein